MPTYAVYGGWIISIIAGWFEVTADIVVINGVEANNHVHIAFGVDVGVVSVGALQEDFEAIAAGIVGIGSFERAFYGSVGCFRLRDRALVRPVFKLRFRNPP
jgi:hypothetical protein